MGKGLQARANTRWPLVGLAAALVALSHSSTTSLAQNADSELTRLAALETRLATLDNEIMMLEDAKAIRRLQRAYAYYVDKKLSGEIPALFAADATAEIGGYGVFVGRERVSKLYDRLLGDGLENGELNNHLMLQSVIHVAPDGRTARGRWRALMQLGMHGVSAAWAEGPYENEYVKEDGVWRISKLHWYMTLAAPYEPGWHLAPQPMPGPFEDLPPDLPPSENYEAYPAPHLPAFHYDNPVSGRPAPSQP